MNQSKDTGDTPNKNDTQTHQKQIEAYISELSEQEKLVMKIAQEHLETSFDITKSIGFQEWQKNK
tara:strand:- start:16 stop:210 length:195 start_codon:yes stop_codon:yes gene_type:complete